MSFTTSISANSAQSSSVAFSSRDSWVKMNEKSSSTLSSLTLYQSIHSVEQRDFSAVEPLSSRQTSSCPFCIHNKSINSTFTNSISDSDEDSAAIDDSFSKNSSQNSGKLQNSYQNLPPVTQKHKPQVISKLVTLFKKINY